jgi:hypothetical protein
VGTAAGAESRQCDVFRFKISKDLRHESIDFDKHGRKSLIFKSTTA